MLQIYFRDIAPHLRLRCPRPGIISLLSGFPEELLPGDGWPENGLLGENKSLVLANGTNGFSKTTHPPQISR